MELEGRIGIVTGASRGLGVHIARALAQQGVQLALVARTAPAIEQLARELTGGGARAVAIAADLEAKGAAPAVLERVRAELGEVDLLINNAGIDAVRFFADERAADTEQMLRLDLLAPMLLAREVLPGMLARKRGHVVNIASLAGKTGTPYSVTYATAKGGLVTFTHSLRAELRGTGVSASVICPGFVTDEGMFAERQRAHGVRVSKLLGTSTPEQVARAVVDAVRHDRAEVAVNPGPVRAMQALQQVAPGAAAWVQARLLGVDGVLKTIALASRNPGPQAKE